MRRAAGLAACAALLLAGPAQARGSGHAAVASPHVARDSHGRIARSPEARHSFMSAHPCPGGPDAGSTSRCQGYVVDHVNPLACGGPDAPENMQWQTEAAGKAKDKTERKACGR